MKMDFSLIIMPIYTSVLSMGILYAATRRKYTCIYFTIFGSSVAVPIFLGELGVDFAIAFGIWFGSWIIIYIYLVRKHRGLLEKLDEELGKKKSKK